MSESPTTNEMKINLWHMHNDGTWHLDYTLRIIDGHLKIEGRSMFFSQLLRNFVVNTLGEKFSLNREDFDILLRGLNQGPNRHTLIALEDGDPMNEKMTHTTGPVQDHENPHQRK